MFIGKVDGQNSGLNISSINRTAAHKLEQIQGQKQQEEKRDQVILSPGGRKQSLLEQMMKQKELLQERKQALVERASENGAQGIQEELDAYEEQIKQIDEQIAQLQAEQTEVKEKEEQGPSIYEKPKTEEQAKAEQLEDITKLSAAESQAEQISSVQGKMDGRVRVLKAEIKSGYGNIEAKLEEAGELESRSQKLSSEIAGKLNEVNESIGETNDKTAESVEPGAEDSQTVTQSDEEVKQNVLDAAWNPENGIWPEDEEA